MAVILGIDHGTTRTKAVAFDRDLRVVAQASVDLRQIYPRPGWVEQDPLEILHVTHEAVVRCLSAGRLRAGDVAAVGLANQGETVVMWERSTGTPVYNAIVWQDRRTGEMCDALRRDGKDALVHERTGVFVDPYFSATKLRWILDHVPDGQARAERGELLAGTTDTWLIWQWSDRRLHVTDPSTASRTMLFNLHQFDWDPELLRLFGVPRQILPLVVPSAGVAGEMRRSPLEQDVPLTGLAVDQQAALFGHSCLQPGMAKVTYGTGAFVLMTIGPRPTLSQHGLITTVAWHLPDRRDYAFDGGLLVAGAAVQWLRDGLGILDDVNESESVAASVPDSGGVYFVPALAGLAAPHWAPKARGMIVGLTSYTTRAHLVRATLEGIAFGVRDIVEAMDTEAGTRLEVLRADGGPTGNTSLMQVQADLLGVPVEVAAIAESTALGAAGLAGVGLGWWTPEEIGGRRQVGRVYRPDVPEQARERRYAEWHRAVELAKEWMGDAGP